jgi:hypothetical protein|nr:MAG TPA: hypothetical protein [Caudoviricetes sp.]
MPLIKLPNGCEVWDNGLPDLTQKRKEILGVITRPIKLSEAETLGILRAEPGFVKSPDDSVMNALDYAIFYQSAIEHLMEYKREGKFTGVSLTIGESLALLLALTGKSIRGVNARALLLKIGRAYTVALGFIARVGRFESRLSDRDQQLQIMGDFEFTARDMYEDFKKQDKERQKCSQKD